MILCLKYCLARSALCSLTLLSKIANSRCAWWNYDHCLLVERATDLLWNLFTNCSPISDSILSETGLAWHQWHCCLNYVILRKRSLTEKDKWILKDCFVFNKTNIAAFDTTTASSCGVLNWVMLKIILNQINLMV